MSFSSSRFYGASTKHEQVRAWLLHEIDTGNFSPSHALPTEFEICEQLNVSRNTVRQAFASLEQMGLIYRVRGRGTFVHEVAVRKLKSIHRGAKADIFALVTPDVRGGYYPALQKGFSDAASDFHHQVVVCDTSNDAYRQADSILQLIDSQVAGVAIVPTTTKLTPAYQIRPLIENGIPVVFCHRKVEGIKAPLISFSARDVGRLAAKALVEAGHQRIAFFSPALAALALDYKAGMEDELQHVGIALSPDLLCCDEEHLSRKERDARLPNHLDRILADPNPPTAIFCSFDTEAEQLFLLLGQRGIKVPEQVSIIGFGGKWRDGAITRILTSVTVDEEAVGRNALKVLQKIRTGEMQPHEEAEILLPVYLSKGETIANLNVRR